MTNIIFEIGDWSGDGHSYSAEFLVKSNKDIKELRKVHLKENQFIGSLCSDYEDNKIAIFVLYEFFTKYMSEEKAKEEIKSLIESIDTEILDCSDINEEWIEDISKVSFAEEDEHFFHMYSQTAMLEIWLKLLEVIDPSFEYEIISEPMSRYYIKYKGYPDKVDGEFHHYGYIDGTHIDTPGYGTWSCDESEFYHGD